MKTASNSRVLRTIPLLLIAVLFCPLTYGKVIYVDDDAVGANNGTSWTDAYNHLQDGLADAVSGDEIRVAQGIYKPDLGGGNVPGDREATFQLINDVVIKGGFDGLGDVRDVEAYETILSGDLNGDDVEVADLFDLWREPTRAENSYHVLTGSWTDETAVLDGFTITGGNANGRHLGDEGRLRSGGGMYNHSGNPTLRNCIFSGNSANSFGGGMYNVENSSPTLTNCTFSENSAIIFGGGMYNVENSSPTLTNCTFSGNGAANGGGMLNWESSPTLSNCTFSGNHAGRTGGGMHNHYSSPILTNCTFSGNSAEFGAGMSNYESSPTLTNCTFSGNRAEGSMMGAGEGGMYNYESSPTLTNCILWYNIPDLISGGNIMYSNIEGGFPGEGNIDADPLFAALGYYDDNGTPNDTSDDYWVDGDYHLKSQAGRFDPNTQTWVVDDVTSPCIDAGDPNTTVVFESFPNGGIINMGAYGGTGEASKSPSGLHTKYGGGTGEPNDPYLIYTAKHLNAIGAELNDWDKHFKLMADIDLLGYSYNRAVIAPGVGDSFGGPPFSGVFDGNGHVIGNLHIQGSNYLGLFGGLGSGAKVSNLGLEAVDVNGTDCVGGLVGSNGIRGSTAGGILANCYSTGTVYGAGHAVGGLVGDSYGSIATSYSTATVSGGWCVGGLVGDSYGSIATSYSTGAVTGDYGRCGGLVATSAPMGHNSVIAPSFWDVETSGLTASDGGVGLTTAEMQTASTFLEAGWDFVDEVDNGTEDIWWILEGQDYPRLWWEEQEPADFGHWIRLSSMKSARDQFAGGVIGDEIFVFGGNAEDESDLYSGEKYNMSTDTWFNIADNPHGLGWGVEEVSGIALNGKFYVFGALGRYNDDGDHGLINYNEMYDPATNTWTTLAEKPTATRAAVPVVYEDKIYLFGGMGENNYYRIVECYDPDKDTWRYVTEMPKAIVSKTIAVHNDSAYIIGGYDGDAGEMNDEVLTYDFQTDTWIQDYCTAPKDAARVYPYATQAPAVNGKIYLVGGIEVESLENSWTCDRFTIFDIESKSWESGPALPEPRDNHLAVVKNNMIYVIGGDDAVDTPTDTVFSLRLPASPDF